MSFLKKLFGQRDPLQQMRHFADQGNWASAFIAVRKMEYENLSAEERAEVAALEVHAGDKLAELNLVEGEGQIGNGNLLRARDHFQLACEQARSPALRQQAEAALASLDRGELPQDLNRSATAVAAGCDCGSARGSQGGQAIGTEDDGLDDDVRFEVLLATLPEALAARYLAVGDPFRRAWLASHDDDPRRALELLEAVPEAERDALFYCERGNLRGRSHDLKGALADLRRALADEPDLFVALSTTVGLLAGSGQAEEAEQLLRKTLAEERFPGYCQANLAQLLAHRGAEEEALQLAGQAVAAGFTDPATMQLCATILEKRKRFDEAEAMLARLPAGAGCAGGVHPLLAEFWLRRKKNLDKALEAFKGALRKEPDDPRWLLRIAQTYLARGWKNEAAEQLDRLLAHQGLTEEVRSEVQATADQLREA